MKAVRREYILYENMKYLGLFSALIFLIITRSEETIAYQEDVYMSLPFEELILRSHIFEDKVDLAKEYLDNIVIPAFDMGFNKFSIPIWQKSGLDELEIIYEYITKQGIAIIKVEKVLDENTNIPCYSIVVIRYQQ